MGGGNERSIFYSCRTDMNGNAQTEVITGPAASAAVIGLKTLKQFHRLHQIQTRQVQLHWVILE